MNYSQNHRQGDLTPNHREDDDRYFELDGQWYFTTREGLTMGPYQSRALAVSETTGYIKFINTAKSNVINLIKRRSATISPKLVENYA